MGREHLRPLSQLTTEELHKATSNGGKRSAEVRRMKKTMREWAQSLGSVIVTNADGEDITRFGLIVQKQIEKAVNDGDTKSAEFLANLLGEMKQQVEVSTNRTDQQAAEAFDKIFGVDDKNK